MGNLQRTIIPPGSPRIPGYESAWAFHPLGQTSGDMFGIFPLDEHHAGVFVVDVSGHGAAAAMLSSAVARLLCPVPGQDNLVKRRLTHHPYYEIVDPLEVVHNLREWFVPDQLGGLHFTLVYAVLSEESGELEWVSAGHVPPILVRDDGCMQCTGQFGQTPIGLPIEPQGDAVSNRVTLAPGQRIVFCSDGLVDLRDRSGVWLPDDALRTAVSRAAQLPVRDSVASIVAQLRQRSGCESFADDVTLLAVERRQASRRDHVRPKIRPAQSGAMNTERTPLRVEDQWAAATRSSHDILAWLDSHPCEESYWS